MGGRGGGPGGGDGKHTCSSDPAQHCIHARERGSAPAPAHPLSSASTHAGGVGGGDGRGMVSTPAQAHPLSTASTHAKEEAHLLKRTRSALHPRMRGSSRSLPSTRDATHVERPCGRFLCKARRKASDVKKKHEAECKTQPPRASLDGIKHG